MNHMQTLWQWCVEHGRQPTTAQMLSAIAVNNGLPVPDTREDPEQAAYRLLLALKQQEALRQAVKAPGRPNFVAIVRDKDGNPKFEDIKHIPQVMWDRLTTPEQARIREQGGYPEGER